MTEPAGSGTESARLRWDDQGQPLSERFDDVYFSRADGLAETRHVFLAQNSLSGRFAAIERGGRFVIGETGFGSGLNFLAAWQLWRERAPVDATLHFISVDKFPLRREDLTRALGLWPELQPLVEALTKRYPPIAGPGFHRCHFDGGRVRLTLIFDDAARGFEQLRRSDHPAFAGAGPRIDAWFLDGFAPAKNADMWTPALFSALADLSGPGTTAATFTSAGVVKRGLRDQGFETHKVPGFGRKREMLTARFAGRPAAGDKPHRFRGRPPLPWALPDDDSRLPLGTERHALIIGAGLAGCHSARALAERGWRVTLLERHPGPAAEASGNPQGLLYAKLSPKPSPLARFNLLSLGFAQSHYRPYWQAGIGRQCGALHIAEGAKKRALQEALAKRFSQAPELVRAVDTNEASALAGVALPSPALHFPGAGWLDPRRLCEALIDHPNIRLGTGTEITRLVREGGQWLALNDRGESEAHAPVAVLANASAARRLAPEAAFPLKPIRGQISQLVATEDSRRLKTALCGDGYLAPAGNEHHCLGATFNLGDTNPEPTERDHQANLALLDQFGPAVRRAFNQPNAAELTGRVAFRCTTPDYLPLVGPVPDTERFLDTYAPLRKDARLNIPVPGPYRPGLFINVGHGSRGLCYTPLGAELLAAHIADEPLPMDRELMEALHPARFLIRDLKRNNR